MEDQRAHRGAHAAHRTRGTPGIRDTPVADRPGGAPARSPRGLVLPILGVCLVVLVTVIVGRLITAAPAIEALDLAWIRRANGALGPFTSELASGIDLAWGSGAAPVAVAVVIAAGILARRLRTALGAAVLIAVPWGVVHLEKVMVQRPRPDPGVIVHVLVPDPQSFSYPSGHTAFVTAVCCAVVILLRGRRRRLLAVVLAVGLVLLTTWSRVALGVHHPTDVLASVMTTPAISLLVARALAALGVLAPPTPRGRDGAPVGEISRGASGTGGSDGNTDAVDDPDDTADGHNER
ncbi:hypothetical protein DEO23_06875 [Brachybacterium endophyticum]|uniref:Phosphatidic acid phosphatase type 2/haloperoxidase domain-containing protein n=1 Tax=Brachybacterium endophyticum TaxID=2182385 RepID=A0A2U2RLA5_9MICO|nr:hypothetical protein DEO23_06875 [Brachybacterium endophyticum]